MRKRHWIKLICNLDLLLGSAILIGLVLVTSISVFMRYILRAPLLWQEEVQAFCQVWLVFLGGSVAFRTGGIVAIEMIVDAITPNYRRYFEYLIDFVVIFTLTYLAVQARAYLIQVFLRNGRATPILRIPYATLYGVAPYGCVLMLLSYLANRYIPHLVEKTSIGLIEDQKNSEKEEANS